MNRSQALEAILFYKGEPVSYETLVELLACEPDDLADAIVELENTLADRGIRLVRDKQTVELTTASEASDIINALTQREFTKRLGKAGLETLTIILYQGPVTRRDIDYIRGVNSTQVIRNLLIRGLIRKRDVSENAKLIYYEPTTDLLKHLGITSVDELPEFNDIRSEIAAFYEQER